MANQAHSTHSILLRQTTGSAGLLPASLPGGRIVAAGGPVSRVLLDMQDVNSDLARIRRLKRVIAARIDADLALLDALDGDADLEDGHDREHDEAERGIADVDGIAEQVGSYTYGFVA